MRLEYFQMIDRVVAADAENLTAEARVPDASPVFEGHFPGHPLVPGVLLVETMAQASGFLLLQRMDFARMPFLASVKEAKLRSFVGPGAVLRVEAQLVHEGSGYAVTSGRIEAGGKRLCDAELTLRILHFPAPELEAAMRAQAARIGLAAAGGRRPDGAAAGHGATNPFGSPASAWCPASARARSRTSPRCASAGARPRGGRGKLRALPGAPAAGARPRPADPEEGRPAADGALAAARHLRRRPRHRQRRRARPGGRHAPGGRGGRRRARHGARRGGGVGARLPAAGARRRRCSNERLASGLRPTLFLAQLSNLLAGNISIVHGVTGSSRTFMGEEVAGADAVRIAAARLAEGRGGIALVGGAYVAGRWDMLLLYALGRAAAARRLGADGGAARRHGPGQRRRLPGAGNALARGGARREGLRRARAPSPPARRGARARTRPRASAAALVGDDALAAAAGLRGGVGRDRRRRPDRG